jgi:hypothetical protein
MFYCSSTGIATEVIGFGNSPVDTDWLPLEHRLAPLAIAKSCGTTLSARRWLAGCSCPIFICLLSAAFT